MKSLSKPRKQYRAATGVAAKPKTIQDDGLELELQRLALVQDRMYFSQGRWISYRIEIFRDGHWFHPEFMEAKGFQTAWAALESCIRGFPLGSARVVRMEFITNDVINRDELPQHVFFQACAYLGKMDQLHMNRA
jgi:hypothetical protein